MSRSSTPPSDRQVTRKEYRAGPHLHRLKTRPRERLLAHALRLGLARPDAEDLVQDAFVLLLHLWQQGEPIRDWFGFLVGCVQKSGSSTRARERRRSKLIEHQLPTDDIDPGHEDRAIAVVLAQRALDGLPAAKAELLAWRFLEEKPIREVAEHLEIAEGVAKKRIQRALKKARSLFNTTG